jgi:hypothetical protein
VLIQLGVLRYAYMRLGISSGAALLLLLTSRFPAVAEATKSPSGSSRLGPAHTAAITGTRAGGFVLTRQEAAGKWGAATYSLVRGSKA